MIELRHMDVRHFVIIKCSHLANDLLNQMGLHRFDIISLSIGSGAIIRNINTIGFASVYACRVYSFSLWLQVVQPFTRRP